MLTHISRLVPSRSFTMSNRHLSSVPNPLPASFLRGGTSKGIFIHRDKLPLDRSKWDRIFLGIMGSPDPEHGRQLNGMGGGVSSLSKICVVGPPSSEERESAGVQAEYTFAQVGIRDTVVDYSGNCGNLSSMIGVFAVDEGIVECVEAQAGAGDADGAQRTTIRTYNTNTGKIIDTTFPIVPADGRADLELPETEMAGVPGKASRITMDFVDPAGARTGKLLPSGSAIDTLSIGAQAIPASLVDATNPSVFVLAEHLKLHTQFDDYIAGKSSAVESTGCILESLRCEGAVKMGFDPQQAQPKIAILSRPSATGEDVESRVDVVAHALSMGVLHRALPMTLGYCLAVAARTEGTVVWDVVQEARSRPSSAGTCGKEDGVVRIRHPSGVVDVGVVYDESGKLRSVQVIRTGRRLMHGHVYW